MGRQAKHIPRAIVLEFVRKRLARYGLSPREKEIVFLLLRGCSNKEIAEHSRLSPDTIKEYLSNIYRKIGTHQRTALLARLLGTDGS